MSDFIVNRPENLFTANGVSMTHVSSDVYGIAQRVKELDSNLRIVLHEDHPKPWVVVERGPDGEERFVKRFAELDARIIEELQYMRAVPLHRRVAEAEKIEARENEKFGRLTEEQFERLAFDFLKAGRESGILNPKWTRDRPLPKRKRMK